MKKVIAALIVVALLLSFASGGVLALSGGEGAVIRISGANRYATAAAVSAVERTYSGYVVLARGDNYADALAGVPLAAMYQAPILLTPVSGLAPEARAEIEALAPHIVIILGGTAAVGAGVEAELMAMGLTVDRISGANRFATAAAIARRVAPYGSDAAVAASGMDYPDALAAASYAGRLGCPILLLEKGRIPEDTVAVLEELGVTETVLVGGAAVVSDAVMAALPGAVRVFGSNRFATSMALAEHFNPSGDTVFVASGRGFADAITGAALAARLDSCLLLADKDLPDSVSRYLAGREVGLVYILGGTGAVSNKVQETIAGIISLAGKSIEFIASTVMTSAPGGGEVLRYPYTGFVARVLGVSGDYVQIQYGRRTGWVSKDAVALTERQADYIRLGWQFTRQTNMTYIQDSPKVSGYNTYAPVMYGVGSNSLYTLVNFEENMRLARRNGYNVWLTVQQFGTSPNFKENIIDEIIAKALLLDVDGVNIDFEGMGEANRAGFTNFMQRLYPKAKAQGLVVSLDVTRHAANNYGLSYDRAALAGVSDYIALMAYDQHWSTSPVAGSTATMSWADSAIRLLLNEVPAQKVLLGIPFYTRNWRYDNSVVATTDLVMMMEVMRLRTEPTTAGGSSTVIRLAQIGETFTCLGQVEGEVIEGESKWYIIEIGGTIGYVSGYSGYTRFIPRGEVYGGQGLSSFAIPMQAALDIYASYDAAAGTAQYTTYNGSIVNMRNVELVYDEASGQNKVSYVDAENRLNKIWLEDYDSLRQRRQLMDKYGLAGLAAWSLEWLDAQQQAWNMMITTR